MQCELIMIQMQEKQENELVKSETRMRTIIRTRQQHQQQQEEQQAQQEQEQQAQQQEEHAQEEGTSAQRQLPYISSK